MDYLVEKRTDKHKSVIIQLQEQTTLGKACTPSLSAYKNVSDIHARFTFHNKSWYVEDLGSEFGVFVNFVKVGKTSVKLEYWNVIGLGSPRLDGSGFVCILHPVNHNNVRQDLNVGSASNSKPVLQKICYENRHKNETLEEGSSCQCPLYGKSNTYPDPSVILEEKNIMFKQNCNIKNCDENYVSAVVKDAKNWIVPLIKCDSKYFNWPSDVKKVMNQPKIKKPVSERSKEMAYVIDRELSTENQSSAKWDSLGNWKLDTFFKSLEQNKNYQQHDLSEKKLNSLSGNDINLSSFQSFDTQSNNSSVESMNYIMYPSKSVLLEIENAKMAKRNQSPENTEKKEISKERNQTSKLKKKINISKKLLGQKSVVKKGTKLILLKNAQGQFQVKQEKKSNQKRKKPSEHKIKSSKQKCKNKQQVQFNAIQNQDTFLAASAVKNIKLKTNFIASGGCMKDNYSTCTKQSKDSCSYNHVASNKKNLHKYKKNLLSRSTLDKNESSLKSNSQKHLPADNFRGDQTKVSDAVHVKRPTVKKRPENYGSRMQVLMNEMGCSQKTTKQCDRATHSTTSLHVPGLSSKVTKLPHSQEISSKNSKECSDYHKSELLKKSGELIPPLKKITKFRIPKIPKQDYNNKNSASCNEADKQIHFLERNTKYISKVPKHHSSNKSSELLSTDLSCSKTAKMLHFPKNVKELDVPGISKNEYSNKIAIASNELEKQIHFLKENANYVPKTPKHDSAYNSSELLSTDLSCNKRDKMLHFPKNVKELDIPRIPKNDYSNKITTASNEAEKQIHFPKENTSHVPKILKHGSSNKNSELLSTDLSCNKREKVLHLPLKIEEHDVPRIPEADYSNKISIPCNEADKLVHLQEKRAEYYRQVIPGDDYSNEKRENFCTPRIPVVDCSNGKNANDYILIIPEVDSSSEISGNYYTSRIPEGDSSNEKLYIPTIPEDGSSSEEGDTSNENGTEYFIPWIPGFDCNDKNSISWNEAYIHDAIQKEDTEYISKFPKDGYTNKNSEQLSVSIADSKDYNCFDSSGNNFFNCFQSSSKDVIPFLEDTNIDTEYNKKQSEACTSYESNEKKKKNYERAYSNLEREDCYLKLIKVIVEMNPKWLYEKEMNTKPPPDVSKGATLLPFYFDSYNAFVSSFFPMLVLEMWEEISFHSRPILKCKDWNKFNFSVISYEYVNGLMMLHCESVVNKNASFIPTKNNFVLLDLKHESGRWNSTFGFIIEHESKVLDGNCLSTCEWQNLASEWLGNATHLLFNIYVKSREMIIKNCLMKGNGICDLVNKMKQADALSCLKFSPLVSDILKPSWNTFSVSYMEADTNDYIKIQQNIYSTVYDVMKLPSSTAKIVLLQGPPGSGKTNAVASITKKLATCKDFNMKILVIAPSNFAVDEIGNKLVLLNEQSVSPVNFIQLSHTENIHPKLANYSVDKKLQKCREEYESVYKSWKSCVNEIVNGLFPPLKEKSKKNYEENLRKFEAQYNSIKKRKMKKWDHSVEKFLREKILKNASVILATLDDCFELFKIKSSLNFSLCIIDETNQATELDILFPFVLGINKFLLVGDPMQLPPYVKSGVALSCEFQRSILERFQLYFRNKYLQFPGIILSKQFRMHAEIFQFPLEYFYSQCPLVSSYANERSNCPPFKPYLVLNDESEFSTKVLSQHEVMGTNTIRSLCSYIISNHPTSSIAIIVPSKTEQEFYLSAVVKHLPQSDIEVDTIEHFQGREKSVIIISCFRDYASNPDDPINFLYNDRRLNVALTRAINTLIISGPLHHLKNHPLWKALISNADSRGCYMPYTYKDDILSLIKTHMFWP